MRTDSSTYKRRNAERIAAIITAGDDVDPDAYREEHGRCPKGWKFDEDEGKCVPRSSLSDQLMGPRDTPKPDAPPKKKKKVKEEKKERKKKGKEAAQEKEKWDQIAKNASKDPEAYKQWADQMRKEGKLPPLEVAEKLVKIKNISELKKKYPDLESKPKMIDRIIKMQENQAKMEESLLKERKRYLENFKKATEKAQKLGKEPPKLNLLKFMQDTEGLMGRSLLSDPADYKTAEELSKPGQLQRAFRGGATDPGSSGYKFHKWLDKILKPIPTWKPFAQSSTEDPMKRNIIATLDRVAEKLEQRGAKRLAASVDKTSHRIQAGDTDFPEPDEMSDAPKAQPFENDWRLGTSDMGEDLGYPPYDKPRPRVKGDEPL